jgi:hypothetical protein
VKDNNIEFQLAGGGYGTFGDDTDTSVHYTPSDKSRREKDLENQIDAEKDPDRRRSLQRELDRVRRDRQQSDNISRSIAQDAAESKKARIDAKRTQGGSRFNLHFATKTLGDALTPEMVMRALAPYVAFPPETFGASHDAATESRPTVPPVPPAR